MILTLVYYFKFNQNYLGMQKCMIYPDVED